MTHIGIIGTGAMATLFASRLASAFAVTLIGSWQAQIATLTQRGLTVSERDGSQTSHRVAATADPASIAPVDVAIVLTKSYQTVEAIGRIEQCLKPSGVVLTLQNGLGNLELLAEGLPTARVTAGVTAVGATTLALGHVHHAGIGETVVAVDGSISAELSPIIAHLNAQHFPTRTTDDVTPLLWSKVAINTGINPLTALLRVKNGYLADDPTARFAMQAATLETVSIAHANRIALLYNDPAETVLSVARATYENRSSMLQDIERGSPTEIDAICGAVVRAGQRLDIPTPVNQALYEMIISAESAPTSHTAPAHHDILSIVIGHAARNNAVNLD